jgi:hypothetical protein
MENDMPKPFYHWLPDWIQSGLKKRICSQCQTNYSKQDIVAVGVRQVNDPHECAMYVEHVCSSCGYRALTTFGKEKENSLEGMCCGILENIKKKKLMEKSKLLQKQKKGNMTDREVDKFLKFFKDASHEEFCTEIGSPLPEEDNDTS